MKKITLSTLTTAIIGVMMLLLATTTSVAAGSSNLFHSFIFDNKAGATTTTPHDYRTNAQNTVETPKETDNLKTDSTVIGAIEGTVYRELPVNGSVLNTYGQQDSNEPGVKGVLVTVTDANGSVQTTTTAVDGSWTITPGAYPVRVDFTTPEGLFSGPMGTDSHSNVQFVETSQNNVDWGIQDPNDYSSTAAPQMVTTIQINGDPLQDKTTDPPEKATQYDPMLVQFPYSGGDTPFTTLAIGKEIGSAWGIAWQRSTQRLFVSAFLKRHAGLGPGASQISADDPEALGAIYVKDMAAGTSLTTFINVADLGIDVGATQVGTNDADRELRGKVGQEDPDPTVYDLIATVGIGDIDISADESQLWLVNLKQKSLHAITIDADNDFSTPPTTNDVSTYAIPNPCDTSKSEWRPFALKVHRGDIYVGGVCDASISQNPDDLSATIYRFDGSNFSQILNYSLNYTKGYPSDHCTNNYNQWFPWHSWNNNSANLIWKDDCPTTVYPDSSEHEEVHPQPALSDIEFDVDGSMIMSFFDRFGHQIGYNNLYPDQTSGDTNHEYGVISGDILRAFYNPSTGHYELENNGSAGGVTTAGANNNQGPGGGEYYFTDRYTNSDPIYHQETSVGSLAFLPGSGEIAAASMAITSVKQNGVLWFDNQTGARSRTDDANYVVYDTSFDTIYGVFKKANGIGDLEILADPAPLEIGNRLWCDTNSNGIQDPAETPVANATIMLQCDMNSDGFGGSDDVSAYATSDNQGIYRFHDGDTALANFPTAVWDANLHIIPRNTSCRLLVDPEQNAITEACGQGSAATETNAGNDDRIDNDGQADVDGNGNMGTILTTPASGQNTHDYDFGFKPALVWLGDYVWWDEDNDGIQDADEPGLQDVTVSLKNTAGNTLGSTTTDSNGAYSFANITPGEYIINFTLPGSDWSFSPQNQGSDDAQDSDADTSNGNTSTITLNAGDHDATWDAGMNIPSSYSITKENTSSEVELAPGDPISMTIIIENTGSTWLASISMTDTYNSDYIAFASATPAPDDNIDDGNLVWSNLLDGNDQGLAPGESIIVVVNYTAETSTEALPDHETINYAGAYDVTTDPDGPSGSNGDIGVLQDQQAQAAVNILNPVGLLINDFAATPARNAVRLQWQTLDESNMLGFNVLRSVDGSDFQQANDSLILARYAGANLGNAYRYNDRPEPGEQVTYILQAVLLDGRSIEIGRTDLLLQPQF